MSNFTSAYAGSQPPPWDIGRPQAAIVELVKQGVFSGRVLDVGCGTGENALLLAAHGIDALGIDQSEVAIERAKKKAHERKIAASFEVGNAMNLASYGPVDGVLDSGVWHIFDDERRALYTRNLAKVLRPGGLYVSLIVSDLEPGDLGPRRVSKRDLRDSFAEGWLIESIEPSLYENHLLPPAAQAHLSMIRRL